MNKRNAKRIKELSDKLPQRQDGYHNVKEYVLGSDLTDDDTDNLNEVELARVDPNRLYIVNRKRPHMVSYEGELRRIYKERSGMLAVEAYALSVLAHEAAVKANAKKEENERQSK
jgi:hypothetical protein